MARDERRMDRTRAGRPADGRRKVGAWRRAVIAGAVVAAQREKNQASFKKEFENGFESELTDSAGITYRYTICNKAMGRVFAAIGGAFLGMISVGLAELQESVSQT